jgi:hypothetical protein
MKLPFHEASTGNAIVRFDCMHLHSCWQSCLLKGWLMSWLKRSFCVLILKASYEKYVFNLYGLQAAYGKVR